MSFDKIVRFLTPGLQKEIDGLKVALELEQRAHRVTAAILGDTQHAHKGLLRAYDQLKIDTAKKIFDMADANAQSTEKYKCMQEDYAKVIQDILGANCEIGGLRTRLAEALRSAREWREAFLYTAGACFLLPLLTRMHLHWLNQRARANELRDALDDLVESTRIVLDQNKGIESIDLEDSLELAEDLLKKDSPVRYINL